MSLTFALQSLLARHEAYVIEAEEERRSMATTINQLEHDKRELDAANTTIVEENRSLLDQLEDLNNTVATSDTHIHSLNATLDSTRQELNRLHALAARTSELDAQLSSMEVEQANLHKKLASTQDDQRSTVERWKDAERTISTLQDQIDRIEAESKEESLRHAEVLKRFERRTDVERQLENAAGRLKGAAAATSLGRCSDGNNHVVSHFVKDILADNASLQMGIMELREMLMGSNDEVQKLRQLMTLHQQVSRDGQGDSPRATLEKDLQRCNPTQPDSVPALHVHHHYHEASNLDPPARQRSVKARRPRRRRITSGTSTPRSGLEAPGTPWTPTPHSMRPQVPSSAATILSQTSVSIPPPQDSISHRLSMHSARTRSSVAPSSQLSSPHPSMFDFLSDSSRPTSPESVDVFSPRLAGQRSKARSSAPLHRESKSIATPSVPTIYQEPASIGEFNYPDHVSNPHDRHTNYTTIAEGSEEDSDLSRLLAEATSPMDDTYTPSPGLRRCASHESMFPVARTDPKQLRKQQSQLFRGAGPQYRTAFGPSSPTTSIISSSNPVINTAAVTAASSAQPSGTGRAVSSGAISTLTTSLNQNSTAAKHTLGKRVGGWVWGKWGVAPMASTGNLRAKAASSSHAREARPPGVNQKGSLRALQAAKRLSSHVEAITVDEDLLQESLREG
ncbi:MAG: hypothetical protein Q9182_007376 [Xanthomendoza sp. 2 TL-2023]